MTHRLAYNHFTVTRIIDEVNTMSFDPNFTISVYGTNDANFKSVNIDGKSFRRATLTDGGELQLHISHEEKKRERHLAKMVRTIAPTATTPDGTNSIHVVMDQGRSPFSFDADFLIMGPVFLRWCADNLPALLRGES